MPRFTLTLTEEADSEPMPMHVLTDNSLQTATHSFPIPAPKFEHFRHNFREMPHDKIQAIMAILTKPPRAPRIDKGKPRKRSTDQTPPLPGT